MGIICIALTFHEIFFQDLFTYCPMASEPVTLSIPIKFAPSLDIINIPQAHDGYNPPIFPHTQKKVHVLGFII